MTLNVWGRCQAVEYIWDQSDSFCDGIVLHLKCLKLFHSTVDHRLVCTEQYEEYLCVVTK